MAFEWLIILGCSKRTSDARSWCLVKPRKLVALHLTRGDWNRTWGCAFYTDGVYNKKVGLWLLFRARHCKRSGKSKPHGLPLLHHFLLFSLSFFLLTCSPPSFPFSSLPLSFILSLWLVHRPPRLNRYFITDRLIIIENLQPLYKKPFVQRTCHFGLRSNIILTYVIDWDMGH